MPRYPLYSNTSDWLAEIENMENMLEMRELTDPREGFEDLAKSGCMIDVQCPECDHWDSRQQLQANTEVLIDAACEAEETIDYEELEATAARVRESQRQKQRHWIVRPVWATVKSD